MVVVVVIITYRWAIAAINWQVFGSTKPTILAKVDEALQKVRSFVQSYTYTLIS